METEGDGAAEGNLAPVQMTLYLCAKESENTG
jgi:hypothetical protein